MGGGRTDGQTDCGTGRGDFFLEKVPILKAVHHRKRASVKYSPKSTIQLLLQLLILVLLLALGLWLLLCCRRNTNFVL